MSEESLNGIEQEEIEKELFTLVRAYEHQLPNNPDQSMSDAAYDALQNQIPMIANRLTQVNSIDEAETAVEEEISEVIMDAVKSIDPGYKEDKVMKYVYLIVGEVAGLMQGLGFIPGAADEADE